MTFSIATILSLFLGIGLSASAGFRVFLPLFAMSLAAHFGFDVHSSWAWIGSWTAIVALGVATVVEILGYYIPWVDNILDTIAIPLATVAGTLLMASSMTDFDPVLKWGLAIIAGGGTAAAVKSTTASGRLASTATTAGLGNFGIATAETGASTLLSLMSFIYPVVAFILVLITFFGIYKAFVFLKKMRNKLGENLKNT